MRNHKKIELVSDRPSDEDSFDTHDPIAQTILDLVKGNKGGKTIGLEGDWGAGKSTIIKFLSSKIKNIPEIEIIIFDTWEHQGDPLRISLLKTFINYFSSKPYINQEIIRKVRRKLDVRETETQFNPEGGWAAAWIAILIILISIFNATFSALPPQDCSLLWWICLLAPIGLLTIIVIILVNCGSDVLALFTNRPLDSITIITPDKTSVDFKEDFRTLLSEILPNENQNKRKLIIVIDNLDRVARHDALSVWSALRTYLEYSEHPAEDMEWQWREKIWTIIPYSLEGIRNLWDDQENLIKINKGYLVSNYDQLKTERNENLTTNFLEKTFDVKLYVPPLVYAKWSTYLESLLIKAIPRLKNEELTAQSIARIYEYEYYNRNTNKSPTPRDLKLFVNELAASYLSWNFGEEEIPLTHVAYFILWKKNASNSEIINELQHSRSKISNHTERLLDLNIETKEQFLQNISALLYHTDRITAMDLLLGGKLQNVLNSSPTQIKEVSEDLRKLSKHVSFWKVAERILLPEISIDKDLNRLIQLARCFRKSEIFERSTGKSETASIKKSILKAFINIISQLEFTNFNEERAEGLIDILILCKINDPQNTIAAEVLNKILLMEIIPGEEHE